MMIRVVIWDADTIVNIYEVSPTWRQDNKFDAATQAVFTSALVQIAGANQKITIEEVGLHE